MDKIEAKYNLLNQIILVTKNIYILRVQLLEVSKNSNIYKKILMQYQNFLNYENMLYDKINNNSEVMLDFFNYLSQRYDLEEYDISIYYISNLKNNIVYKRVVNKLRDYILYLPLEEIGNSDDFEEINKERMAIRKKRMVNKYLEDDYLQLFINFLNLLIRNNKYINYRSKIKHIQNDLLFVFSNIDEKNLFTNTETPIFLKSKMYSDILGISEKEYKEIKNDLIYAIIIENLSFSLWNELDNSTNMDKIILYNILMTGFSMLDYDSYDIYLEQFKEYIKKCSNGRNYCSKFVKKIEKDINVIRESYGVISLRKTKSL